MSAPLVKRAKATIDSLGDALDAVRGRIAEMKRQRDAIESAPCPRDEALSRLDAWISGQRAVAKREINVGGLIGRDANSRGASVPGAASEPLALLAFVAPEPVRAKVIELIDEAYARAAPGLPEAERRKRLAGLDAEIVAAEREEEAMILEMEDAGIEVMRRPDADPRAVLEVIEDDGAQRLV